jgi:branched-chain amino acid transport system permease protein
LTTELRILTLVAAAVGCLVWLGADYHASILATVGLYAMLGLSLVILGLSGQVSLGHAAFMGLGAYGSALVSLRLAASPWLGLIAGVLLACATSFVIGWITRNLRGHFLALTTLAWGITLAVCFRASGDLTGGASGLGGVPALTLLGQPLSSARLAASLNWTILLLAIGGTVALQRSRAGRAMSAVRQQELMAECFGISVGRVRLAALVGSAALAALAGGLYAHYIGFISPSPFDLSGSIKGLMIAVVGGELSALGAILGTSFVEGLNWALQSALPRLSASASAMEPVFYGLVLIAVMALFPDGLLSRLERRLARRQIRCGEPLPPHDRQQAPGGTVLALEGVGVSFGGVRALDDVTFQLARGEVLGLIGPNGAGKSTAFDVITGLNRRHDGQVTVPASDGAGLALARSFQHTRLLEDRTVLENVMLGADSRDAAVPEATLAATAQACLGRVGLPGHALRLAGTLTLGERRLVEVARALAADPEVLLLDEPAAGLRQGERQTLARLIRDLHASGRTILLVEHDMDLVMGCATRIVVLDRGRVIADGSPECIRRHPAVVEAYLGGTEFAC